MKVLTVTLPPLLRPRSVTLRLILSSSSSSSSAAAAAAAAAAAVTDDEGEADC